MTLTGPSVISSITLILKPDTTTEAGLSHVVENGQEIFLIECSDLKGGTVPFGMPKLQLQKLADRGSNVALAQFIKIVVPGLILAEHIFKGLNRPLCDGDDMKADESKLAVSWKTGWDYWWSEAEKFDPSALKFRESKAGRVFVVNASPNRLKETYQSVDWWIERWYWVEECSQLKGAPVDWETRYAEKLKSL